MVRVPSVAPLYSPIRKMMSSFVIPLPKRNIFKSCAAQQNSWFASKTGFTGGDSYRDLCEDYQGSVACVDVHHTQKKFCILWTLSLGSMLAYSPETFMNHTAYYALYSGFALGGICQMFPSLVLSLLPYPRAFWRLAATNQNISKPATPKEVISSIVVTSPTSSVPDRTMMTQRLAPALQALVQQSTPKA
ncbi:MAG: hypothetical protein O2970_12015 [Proteobacteria bacterium]|nr:hypothetical protein [Pseudomonadota bacterium]